MQTDLCVLMCLCGGGREMGVHAARPTLSRLFQTHTSVQVNKPPQSLNICTAVMDAVFPGLVWQIAGGSSASWFLPSFSYQRPPSPLTRRAVARPVIASAKAEGMTNHITSPDSLQSLCSLAGVLHLCLYRCEWRFMVGPVGRRVMREKPLLREIEPGCLCVLEVWMVGGLIPQPDGDAGGHDLHTGLWVKTEWS